MQNSIQIYEYTYYFNCKIMRKKCLDLGWVRVKRFQVDVPIKRLYAIHTTLKYYIRFIEGKIQLSQVQ